MSSSLRCLCLGSSATSSRNKPITRTEKNGNILQDLDSCETRNEVWFQSPSTCIGLVNSNTTKHKKDLNVSQSSVTIFAISSHQPHYLDCLSYPQPTGMFSQFDAIPKECFRSSVFVFVMPFCYGFAHVSR